LAVFPRLQGRTLLKLALFFLVFSLFGGVHDRYIIPPTPVNYASYSTALGRMQQNTESIQISIISMGRCYSQQWVYHCFQVAMVSENQLGFFFFQKRTKLKRDLLLSDGTE
jgi:hypothetical protein